MARRKSGETLLPSMSSISVPTGLTAIQNSDVAKTPYGQHVVQEAANTQLRIALGKSITAYGIAKAGELQVHASEVFAGTCAGIDRVQREQQGTMSEKYVSTFAHHQKDIAARHIATLYDKGMKVIENEVSHSLPNSAPPSPPPEPKKPKSLLQRIVGG